jgi:hypothetical protein
MITLTDSIVNPAFIEEAYTRVCTERDSDGGWICHLGNAWHWSPTSTVVILHWASGRTTVYGGADANTLWIALRGTPAWIPGWGKDEDVVYETLEGVVNLRKEDPDSDEYTYDWVHKPIPAIDLLRLLVWQGKVDKAWLDSSSSRRVCFDGSLQVEGKHGWDTVMKYTP